MALKKQISPSDFEELPEVLKSEYTLEGDTYNLQVEGLEDTGALKRSKDHEKALRKEKEAELRQLQEKLTELESAKALKSGDLEAFNASWEEKHNAKVAELLQQQEDIKNQSTQRSSLLESELKTILVDNIADTIAAKISTAPKLMRHEIVGRLSAIEGDDGRFRTTVLDENGKPSAMSIEELMEDFRKNPEYKNVIIGSKASGGAKVESQSKPSDRSSSDGENVNFGQLSDEEKIARVTAKIQANKEE